MVSPVVNFPSHEKALPHLEPSLSFVLFWSVVFLGTVMIGLNIKLRISLIKLLGQDFNFIFKFVDFLSGVRLFSHSL